jgi:putative MFS transporter
VVGLLSWLLIPIKPFGMEGWRWVALFPALGAIFVWWIRRTVPESPRWLESRGRGLEAEKVMEIIEAHVESDAGTKLPEPTPGVQEDNGKTGPSENLRHPYTRRTTMLILLNIFQSIGFFGFNNWVPALMESRGASFVKSLQYNFLVAILLPFRALLFMIFADRIERKWQIVTAALCVAVFGLVFAQQISPVTLVVLGGLLTLANGMLSYSFHAYQSEVYPTRVRARAVGFVYSFSRLSTVFSSFMIAFFLQEFGAIGVFSFIAVAMLLVIVSVGVLGPRTSGLALEEIAQ